MSDFIFSIPQFIYGVLIIVASIVGMITLGSIPKEYEAKHKIIFYSLVFINIACFLYGIALIPQ